MNKFFKKISSAEGIGIILLAVLVVFAGYMVYFQKDFKVSTNIKSDSNSKNLAGYNFQNYYNDYYDEDYYFDEYNYENDYYYDEDYYEDDYYYYEDSYYDEHDYNDNYIYHNGQYYYEDEVYGYDYDYDYDYGYNYNNDYQFVNNKYNSYDNYYDYSDTNKPAVKNVISKIVEQYGYYDPMEDISAYHIKFGDVTDLIEITYNDVDTSVPGVYTTVYKACNYPGSIYCRSVSRKVTVREPGFVAGEESNKYDRGPVWSNKNAVTCTQGSKSCRTDNISKPTATDPVTKKELHVELVDGYVDINTPGTYALVYSAETRYGVTGTVSKMVTVEKNYLSNNTNSNTSKRKYISNYHSRYYDDGIYRGYLEEDYSNNQNSKYISNIEWTNRVTYTYRCDVKGQYGTAGWTLVSTDKSNGQTVANADNHPTIFYEDNGYVGVLNKTSFYLKDSESKLSNDLGYCNNVGQTKQVTRTWVGLYAGYVESFNNNKTTYSGYVYSY